MGSLKLCRNNVDDKEAQVLGEILCLILSLKNLDIRGNLIGDKGAKYLGRGLEGNTSLKRILLDLFVLSKCIQLYGRSEVATFSLAIASPGQQLPCAGDRRAEYKC